MDDLIPETSHEYRKNEAAVTSVRDLLLVLRRRRRLIILCTLAGTLLAFGLARNSPPQYTANALVAVDPRNLPIDKIDAAASSLEIDPVTLSTQVNIIRSRRHIGRVVDELDLAKDLTFNPPEPTTPPLHEQLTAWVGTTANRFLANWLAFAGSDENDKDPALQRLSVSDVLMMPGLDSDTSPAVRENLIDRFARSFSARQQGDSSVIELSFVSTSPALAAAAVNTAAELYVRAQLGEKLQEAERLRDWVSERLTNMAREVQQSEEAVEAYRASQGLVDDRRDGRFRQEEMISLNLEATKARAELVDKEGRLQLLRRMQADGDIEGLSSMLSSQVLSSLREQELGLLRQEAELAISFGELHPRRQLVEAEQARLEERIALEVERSMLDLQRDTNLTRERFRQIQAELGNRRDEGYRLSDAEVGLRELERQAGANRELYLLLLERFKEVNEQQDIIEADVRVVSLAQPPNRPSSLSPKLFTLVGLVSSFSGGALLALLFEGLNRRVRSARQIERMFGLKVLDAVPHVSRMGKDRSALLRYLLGRPRSAYAEAQRAIYTSIRLASVDQPPRTVLIASSLSGEGKTTFAASLAIAASQWGQRVMVIDLDLHHPQIATATKIRPEAGIAEVIAGDATIDAAITKTDLGFDVIGVLDSPANTAGLVGDERMVKLLRDLQDRYDLVIIDTPPVLAVSDARVIARLVDQLVFVCRWQMTPLSALRRSLQMLRDAHANIAGIVLLDVATREYMYYENEDGADYSRNLKKYYSG